MVIKAEEGQTIFDLALRYYGCFEGFELICKDNNLTVNSELRLGQNIQIRDEVPRLNDTNQSNVIEFENKGIVINSGYDLLASSEYVKAGYVVPGYVN
ncbi:MAG: hypothetical protein LCH37_12935 [Bacteroidetes bacterium]|nr:hypothetical protein [Bacteroidota bacterium]